MPKTELQEKRQLTHFAALGIPHLYCLGKVELSAHTQQRLLRHVHPDQFEVCFHYDGHQQYEVEGVQYTTKSGDLFITRPNERHGSGDCGEEKSKLFYLIFELTPATRQFMGLPPELSDYIRDTLYQLPCRHIQGAHTIQPLLQKVFDLYDQTDPFRAERIRGVMVEFFYQLTGYIRRHPLPGSMDDSIAIVVQRISGAPGESWTDQNMADLCGLSLSIESSFVPLFKLFQSIHLYNTQFGVILLYIAFRIPLTVFLMRSYFISFPKDIEEAARMDGCSSFAIYWRMILPIGKPILASSALMNLIFTWNEFLTALIFLEDQDLMTIPVGLNALKGEMLQEWNIQLAVVVIASIPLIIMFLCMQKQFVKGLTAGSVKG